MHLQHLRARVPFFAIPFLFYFSFRYLFFEASFSGLLSFSSVSQVVSHTSDPLYISQRNDHWFACCLLSSFLPAVQFFLELRVSLFAPFLVAHFVVLSPFTPTALSLSRSFFRASSIVIHLCPSYFFLLTSLLYHCPVHISSSFAGFLRENPTYHHCCTDCFYPSYHSYSP